MKPKMIPLPEVPVTRIRFKAIRSCNRCFSNASAIRNPPKNKKIMGFAYEAEASLIFITPNIGNAISGTKAVTGIGTASATHHVIIQAATAKTLFAPGEMNVSGKKLQTIRNNNGPRNNPI